jgi:transposase-like protein
MGWKRKSSPCTPGDIEDHLREMYGVAVSATTISAIADKVMPLVDEWRNRPLAALYLILTWMPSIDSYLDVFEK